jgi:acetolactate synthase-1/2/3 large subunit
MISPSLKAAALNIRAHSEIRERVAVRPVETPTAARTLVRALVQAGVETFFGIPGGPVSPVFDAVLSTPGARLIESRHETAAAFAAAAYYRASNKVACVLVTAGPGATNVVTGVASAHLSRTPMLVISGDVAWSSGARLLQDSGPEGIGIEQMLQRVTRATVRVARPESAASQALSALRAATSPLHPGPALLVVPMDRGRAEVHDAWIAGGQPSFSLTAPPEAVAQAASWLAAAERPLLVLGAGARAHAADLRRLVDAFDIPFVTTPQAKGVVSEQHPRSLRHGGLGASLWAREYTQRGVDVALVLGSDLDDCSMGTTRYVREGGRLVHVDLDANVFHRNVPAALGVVADVGSFARQLYQHVTRHGLVHRRAGLELRELKRKSPFDHASFAQDTSTPIAPHRVIADLETACGRDALYITDIGEHMLFALHYLTSTGPDRFHIQLNLGSMGSGVCGAIGLALARPGERVVCICGDGSMQMSGMELLTAVREKLPIVYAVFNDARYNMVYHGYKQLYGREQSWDSPWVDFAAWARAMGVPALTIHHADQIRESSLARLAAWGGPVVLDIRIDREVRLRAAGRNEALIHMSQGSQK